MTLTLTDQELIQAIRQRIDELGPTWFVQWLRAVLEV